MYRLLSTGTLEEKIYQRQIFKGALYDLIHDSNDPSKGNSSQGRLEVGGDDNDHSSKRGRSSRGRVDSSGKCQQRDRSSTGGDSDSTTGAAAAAAGAAAKDPAKQGSRGFSQEELKELFVLKTGTKSDTFDKLRRGLPTAAAADSAAGMLEVGRYDSTTDGEEPGESSREEVAAGGGAVGAAPDNLDAPGEAWADYAGPSQVLDKALRVALLAGTETASGGSGDGETTYASVDAARNVTASDVVTFVREVKRGGKGGQQGRTAGAVSRSPFSALEGTEENSSTL